MKPIYKNHKNGAAELISVAASTWENVARVSSFDFVFSIQDGDNSRPKKKKKLMKKKTKRKGEDTVINHRHIFHFFKKNEISFCSFAKFQLHFGNIDHSWFYN